MFGTAGAQRKQRLVVESALDMGVNCMRLLREVVGAAEQLESKVALTRASEIDAIVDWYDTAKRQLDHVKGQIARNSERIHDIDWRLVEQLSLSDTTTVSTSHEELVNSVGLQVFMIMARDKRFPIELLRSIGPQMAEALDSALQRRAAATSSLDSLEQTKLQQQMAGLQIELNNRAQQVADLLATNQDIKQQVFSLQGEAESAAQTSDRLSDELRSSKQNEAGLVAELRASRDKEVDLGAELRASREKETGLVAKLRDSKDKEVDLGAELRASREKETGLVAKLRDSKDKAAGLVAELRASREKETGLIAELRDSWEKEINLGAELRSASKTEAGLIADLHISKQKEEGLVAELRISREKEAGLVAELRSANKTEVGLLANIHTVEQKESGLVAELRASREKEAGLVAELRSASKKEVGLLDKLHTSKQKEVGLVAELRDSRQTEANLLATNQDIRQQVASLQEEATAAAQANSTLADQLRCSENKNRSLQLDLQVSRGSMHELKERVCELENRTNAQRGAENRLLLEVAELNSDKDRSASKMTRLEVRVRQFRQALQKKEGTLESFRQALQKKEGTLESFRQALQDKEDTIENLQESLLVETEMVSLAKNLLAKIADVPALGKHWDDLRKAMGMPSQIRCQAPVATGWRWLQAWETNASHSPHLSSTTAALLCACVCLHQWMGDSSKSRSCLQSLVNCLENTEALHAGLCHVVISTINRLAEQSWRFDIGLLFCQITRLIAAKWPSRMRQEAADEVRHFISRDSADTTLLDVLLEGGDWGVVPFCVPTRTQGECIVYVKSMHYLLLVSEAATLRWISTDRINWASRSIGFVDIISRDVDHVSFKTVAKGLYGHLLGSVPLDI